MPERRLDLASENGIRKKRREQLLRPAGNYTWGGEVILGFVESARLLLLAARGDRGPSEGDNFLTRHGPSAILVASTAFELLLNAALNDCLIMLQDPDRKYAGLATRDSLTEKFRMIPALVTGGPELANADIELVHEVRNEIVHYYPRPVGKTNVPEWLAPLVTKNLLYSIDDPQHEIAWHQKLESYQLARWCAATIARAADQFAAALAGGETDECKLSLVVLGAQ